MLASAAIFAGTGHEPRADKRLFKRNGFHWHSTFRHGNLDGFAAAHRRKI
jgi:hypothetical protein